MNLDQLTAADLMSSPALTIAATETLRSAANLMLERNIHCLLVPRAPGQCVGVITSKDLVLVLCDGETELLDQLHVSDAMTTPAISVQRAFRIRDCMRLMRMSGVRSVPVLDGVQPVGVLSFTDVLRAAASTTNA